MPTSDSEPSTRAGTPESPKLAALPPHPLSRRVVILGDSWIRGLGVKRAEAFGQLAAAELGAEQVLNLSGVSKSAGDMVAKEQRIRDFEPTLAILFCGGTESLVHPGPIVKTVIDRFGPKSWRGLTGLEPRIDVPSRSREGLQQRVSALLKSLVKRWTITLTGGRRRTPLAETRANFDALIELLHDVGCLMVFSGMPRIHERNFPGTGKAILATEVELRAALNGRSDAVLVNVSDHLRYWDDYLRDNLHLNQEGHRRVAQLMVKGAQTLMAASATEPQTTDVAASILGS